MHIIKDNPKFQSIYNTGKNLFWKHGIKRVTIEEVCKEAGVSKMTFYKFFPNKIELAKTIWHEEVTNSLSKYREVVDSNLEFQDKIEEMITIKLKVSEELSTEFISDIYKMPELGLQSQIEKYSNESLEIFVNFLNNSQKTGLIRKDIKIEFIMYYFNQMSKIFDDENLVSIYKHPQDLIMESMNFLFYGLLSKK